MGKGGRVGSLHASRDVKMEALFLSCQPFAWCLQKVTDDGDLFRVSQAMRVVGCGVVDMFAASHPHRVGVCPKRSDHVL